MLKIIISFFLLIISLSLSASINNQTDVQNSQLSLSKEEQVYLDNKKELHICVIPHYLPYSDIDINGRFIGVVADIVNEIQDKTSTKIVLNPTATWAESLQKMKDKECDILPMVIKTKQR